MSQRKAAPVAAAVIARPALQAQLDALPAYERLQSQMNEVNLAFGQAAALLRLATESSNPELSESGLLAFATLFGNCSKRLDLLEGAIQHTVEEGRCGQRPSSPAPAAPVGQAVDREALTHDLSLAASALWAVCELTQSEENFAPDAIRALAEKAGALTDRSLRALGHAGMVGDWADWANAADEPEGAPARGEERRA